MGGLQLVEFCQAQALQWGGVLQALFIREGMEMKLS